MSVFNEEFEHFDEPNRFENAWQYIIIVFQTQTNSKSNSIFTLQNIFCRSFKHSYFLYNFTPFIKFLTSS